MSPIIIIPARIGSTRLPEKILADLGGRPMIVRVLEKALEADIGPVVVACDDERVAHVVQESGGQVCLTKPDVPSGSDRVYAALSMIDPQERYTAVINLQGDSPLTNPEFIRLCLDGLKDFDVCTLAAPLVHPADIENPNVCKVALGGTEDHPWRQAIYFSRSPIPWGSKIFYGHMGLYAYNRWALGTFVNGVPSLLETTERLEQLRALEKGLTIGVHRVDTIPQEVNTLEDLERVRPLFSKSLGYNVPRAVQRKILK